MRKNEKTIENAASSLRNRLGIENVKSPCMLDALEKLKGVMPGFEYEVVLDSKLPNGVEAEMDVTSKLLTISGGLWRDLQNGYTRARFTISHELGHLILGHSGSHRRDREFRYGPKSRIFEDEADRFAGYFLAPYVLAKSCNTAQEISEVFQLSLSASEKTLARIQRQSRQRSGKIRQLPTSSIKAMLELEKNTGAKFKTISDEDRRKYSSE
ncbi:MAG: ImmA/IrrE family metallo-endopeptidase [Pseudomonadota bacterium]